MFLQRGFDLKAPRFEQRFRNILRILIPARPLPQAGGANVLIWRQFVFLDNLFKRSNRRHNRTDWLGFTPVWISAAFCHEFAVPLLARMCAGSLRDCAITLAEGCEA